MTNEAQNNRIPTNEALGDDSPNVDGSPLMSDSQGQIDSQQTQQKAVPEAPRQLQYQLRCPQLPLAVYREVAVHLRQLDGVETGLLPQTAQEFDYLQSQVGGLWIRYPEAGAEIYQRQVEVILKYYGERYHPWETITR